MSKLEKVTFPLIGCVVIVAYTMSQVMDNEAFSLHWMIREDGFLESLTTIVLLVSAILCWMRCWQLRDRRSTLFLSCTALYGCVLFFGMGEEISWGQRIFNVETPEYIKEINTQGETNFHNIVIGETKINKLIFGKLLAVGLLCYLIPLPLLFNKSSHAERLINRFAVPIPRIQHIVAILAIAIFVETSPAGKRGEILEFALTSMVLLILINPLNIDKFIGGDRKSSGEQVSPAHSLKSAA